jgi:hypothetical protein
LINILAIAGGFILVSVAELEIKYIDIIILSLSFSTISLVTITIFHRGQSRDPESQTMHSLVGVGLKFLLDLVLALLWFIVAKKNSLQYVLIFFVLYLTLTLFLVLHILKTLKNKPL